MTPYSPTCLIAAGALIALIVGVGAVFWPAIAALFLLGIFAAASFLYLGSIPLVILLLCSMASLPSIVQVGPASGLAALTILYVAVFGIAWLASKPSASPIPRSGLPYAVFLAWAFTSTIANSQFDTEAIQNLLVLSIPALLIALLSAGTQTGGMSTLTLQRAWSAAAVLSILFFLLVEISLSSVLFLDAGSRSFALFALLCVAWHAAAWKYGSNASMWLCVALLAGIGISLSRTALIVSILLVVLSRFNPTKARDWAKTVGMVVVGSIGVFWAIARIDPLRERFFEGDTSLQIGGLSINAMGRTWMWETTLESYKNSMWVGQGSASVQKLMSSLSTNISHPHNDYLRILHDFGAIGFVLWVAAISTLMYHSVRSWINAGNSEVAKVHLATTLAIIGLSLSMLTDNPIVYVFCMVPLGIGLGSSLAIDMRPTALYNHNSGRSVSNSHTVPPDTASTLLA